MLVTDRCQTVQFGGSRCVSVARRFLDLTAESPARSRLTTLAFILSFASLGQLPVFVSSGQFPVSRVWSQNVAAWRNWKLATGHWYLRLETENW